MDYDLAIVGGGLATFGGNLENLSAVLALDAFPGHRLGCVVLLAARTAFNHDRHAMNPGAIILESLLADRTSECHEKPG
jgi:hypothetical protein